jgi:hypothetical protein
MVEIIETNAYFGSEEVMVFSIDEILLAGVEA